MTNQSKVATVEAQAVPDQPVATLIRGAGGSFKVSSNGDALKTIYALPPGPHPLFTRPTPAAADLHQQIMNLPINWTPGTSIPTSYLDGHRDARRAAAQLVAASPAAADLLKEAYAQILHIIDDLTDAVDDGGLKRYVPRQNLTFSNCIAALIPLADRMLVAASPAAAAGVPTGLRWRDDMLALLRELRPMADYGRVGTRDIDQGRYQRALDSAIALLDASPVAPVGAPTEEQITQLAERYELPWRTEPARFIGFARALLSRPGCELATDATKQLGEQSVHLAATPIDQDFRRRPASSEAAPTQQDSDSVHEAMSTSSVPTAAPLLSLSESGCSELPLRADVENGFILDERGEIVCQFWNKCEDDFAKKAENMRCIVNAMNSHDELVTALREIAEHGNAWTHEGLVMIARDALETRK